MKLVMVRRGAEERLGLQIGEVVIDALAARSV
jgi:hypothetical protein